jgi:death-on-curing protein
VKEPIWVVPAVAVALHGRLLAEHGGAEGLRDWGALDAALGRPLQILTYGKPDLCDLAAAYASAIVRNHPFVDGNKRVAFMLAYVFLGMNGCRLVADEAEATIMTLGLAASSVSEPEYAKWLRRNAETAKRGG